MFELVFSYIKNMLLTAINKMFASLKVQKCYQIYENFLRFQMYFYFVTKSDVRSRLSYVNI